MQIITAILAVLCFFQQATLAQITTHRAPENGLAPQAVTDPDGRLHLIYFKGDPSHGDIFYVRSDDAGGTFTSPMRVNSQPGSALVIGSVRSPQLAVGRKGRVCVAWVGSSIALPKCATALDNKTPMLFARLNDAGTGFEAQRNLVTQHAGLDGGGSVAADRDGNVYVAWHAPKDTPGEIDRWVWITRSIDDGKTFAPESAANPDPTGACGCCGLKINAGTSGEIFLAYRSATESVHREMILLRSDDFGKSFKPIASDPWDANVCVMSTADLATSPVGDAKSATIGAWETRGQIHYACLSDPKVDDRKSAANTSISAAMIIQSPPGQGQRKHPAIAINSTGSFLIVWAEGTGWNKGGRIAWQSFDPTGKPAKAGVANDLSVWSQPTAIAKPDGSFVIFY